MSICAISTSWRAGIICNAEELVETMIETGMKSLELEFRISSESFEKIRKNYSTWGLKIVSLHAVCPSPSDRIRGSERYLISDENEKNRTRGVDHVRQTLLNAADIQAQAIILHCGRIPSDEPIDIMKKHFDEGKINSSAAKKDIEKISSRRTALKKKSFQSLLKSLDEINKEAEKLNIKVGLENRYYFFEFPDMEELKFIFNRFEGSKLAYWHDTGHAQVNENLFGVSQESLLKTFNDQLIGVHLHDVLNGHHDHYAPGCGMVDFGIVMRYLKTETIRVMELNQRVNLEEAKQGIDFLKNKKIF